MTMRVTVQVVGHLVEFFPRYRTPAAVELPGPATVAQILAQAGISPQLPAAVFAGGERVDDDFVPADGAELLVVSPVAGG